VQRQARGAEAELERLEKAASTAEGKSALYLMQLRISKEKNKVLAGELRFAENRIFKFEDKLERDLQAEAETAHDKTDEGYDEAEGVESWRNYALESCPGTEAPRVTCPGNVRRAGAPGYWAASRRAEAALAIVELQHTPRAQRRSPHSRCVKGCRP